VTFTIWHQAQGFFGFWGFLFVRVFDVEDFLWPVSGIPEWPDIFFEELGFSSCRSDEGQPDEEGFLYFAFIGS
jgi:hypothetical protein